MTVTASVRVANEYYIGPLPVHMKGLQDMQDGAIITKKLRTGFIEPGRIEKGLVPGWTKIEDPGQLSVKVMFALSYEDTYDDAEESTGEREGEGPVDAE